MMISHLELATELEFILKRKRNKKFITSELYIFLEGIFKCLIRIESQITLNIRNYHIVNGRGFDLQSFVFH